MNVYLYIRWLLLFSLAPFMPFMYLLCQGISYFVNLYHIFKLCLINLCQILVFLYPSSLTPLYKFMISQAIFFYTDSKYYEKNEDDFPWMKKSAAGVTLCVFAGLAKMHKWWQHTILNGLCHTVFFQEPHKTYASCRLLQWDSRKWGEMH